MRTASDYILFLGIRSSLLETEDHICPACQETEISPDSLIPNKFLRQAVENFKNETGYTKAKQKIKEKREAMRLKAQQERERYVDLCNIIHYIMCMVIKQLPTNQYRFFVFHVKIKKNI